MLLATAICLLSCGVQKRKYQKGYYASWHKSKSQKETKNSRFKTKENNYDKPLVESLKLASNEDSLIVASTNNGITPLVVKKQKPLFINDEPCDELIYRDGSEIKGKVIEITPTEIKYKKCDMLDGPLYVVKKSSMFMVKYANGTRDVFKENTLDSNKHYSHGIKKNNNSAILSLIFGILGLFPSILSILSIFAILTGRLALKKIKQQPDVYKGEIMSKVGIVLGIIGLVAVILLFAYVIIILF